MNSSQASQQVPHQKPFLTSLQTPLKKIQLKNVEFGFSEDQKIFQNFNCSFLDEQGAYQLVAAQGMGKSLFLQLLGGIIAPQSGSLYLNDIDFHNMSFESSLSLRLNIGISFDLGGLLHNRTLYENLLLPIMYHKYMDYNSSQKYLNELFERFDIAAVKNMRPSFVTGSARKMANLIRAVILRPNLLLLDDPFVGLSLSQKKQFDLLLGELKSQGYLKWLVYSNSTQSEFVHQKVLYLNLNKDGLELFESIDNVPNMPNIANVPNIPNVLNEPNAQNGANLSNAELHEKKRVVA